MTTELSVYQRMPDPLAAIVHLGKSIALSGFFGCSTVHQGEIFAMECLSRGISPLTLQQKNHIIFGQISKKTESSLADFNLAGGKHQIISRTPELAIVELTKDGKSERFSLSWEEAQAEPFPYAGKESEIIAMLEAGKKPRLKAKYATPRSRTQMLWARVVSDAIRATFPAASQGTYCPEEIADMAGDDSEVLEAEFTVTSEPAVAVESNGKAETKPSEQSRSDRIGDLMIRQIFELAYAVVGKNGDAAAEFLKQHGVSNVAELSPEQAGGLLEKLKSAKVPVKKTEAAATAKTESTSVKETDPATETQVARAKALLKELEQVKSGTVARFGELLAASGRKKIADLTVAQCDELIRKLVAKEMEAFFTESLKPKN